MSLYTQKLKAYNFFEIGGKETTTTSSAISVIQTFSLQAIHTDLGRRRPPSFSDIATVHRIMLSCHFIFIPFFSYMLFLFHFAFIL